ncbi:TetR/AcrR family transcriptional regulator [Nocardiopsis metallicus]|uniref:AcrR family transcriptional regulator n=1 Tax=Nocardiopsis metallicus TaxID=179819 RepID=A0A840W0J9_9ACTN|nr:TetR/AcrR family transcriptional regulator [Nocardiopsis metallicus]MBB5490269.1 AcrR family transcriptional regulator [Nocardiopsis metallicus]
MDAQPADGRTARSLATRARIARAATRLFTTDGYAATSITSVAKEAGVAAQTVYNTCGTKAGLLKEALDQAVAGDAEPVATLDRPWVREALSAEDPHELIRLQVRGTAQVMARVAALIEVLRGAAASDPELAALWRINTEQRRTVHTVFAQTLSDRGTLRPNLSPEEAADTLLGLLSPELYTLYTAQLGWSPERWTQWAADAVTRQLLEG